MKRYSHILGVFEFDSQLNIIGLRTEDNCESDLNYSEVVDQITEYVKKHGLEDELQKLNLVKTKKDLEKALMQNINIKQLIREKTKEELTAVLIEYCPNLFSVCGIDLCAKLLSLMSLKDMAMKSSGTILTLGDEKNYFRNKSFTNSILMKQFGDLKKAREIAGKISIAAKKDYFKDGGPK